MLAHKHQLYGSIKSNVNDGIANTEEPTGNYLGTPNRTIYNSSDICTEGIFTPTQ